MSLLKPEGTLMGFAHKTPTARTRRVTFDIEDGAAERWENWLRESNIDLLGFLLHRDQNEDDVRLLAECGITVARDSIVRTKIDWDGMKVGEKIRHLSLTTMDGSRHHDRRVVNMRSKVAVANKRHAPKRFGTRTEGDDVYIVRLK